MLSGVFLTASFPKVGIAWIAWGALVPLLCAIRNESPWGSFRIGLLSGFVHFLTLTYWLADTMQTFGQLPWYVSFPILVLFSLYLSLFFAGFSILVNRFSKKPFHFAMMTPIFWVTTEFLRATLLSGFPWEMMGYSQYRSLHIIQVADIVGVYGISFLVALGNACIFLCWIKIIAHFRKIQPATDAQTVMILGVFSVLLIGVWVYGSKRLEQIDQSMAIAPAPDIALIQGNISQSIKWNPDFCLSTTEKYIGLSQSTLVDKPALIVWPETATPFYFLDENKFSTSLIKMIRNAGTDFIIGSPAIERKGPLETYRNRAYLMSSDGNPIGYYDKARLVPFGEFVPFKDWLPFIGKIVAEVGDFEAGPEGKTLRWRTYGIGMQICYEMIFPFLSRKMARNGATCIINITNDAWYGTSSAPYQLFSMAIFRAVENRRTVIRAANTGISGVIDPVGRVLGSTALFTDATITRKIPMIEELSIYTRYGDVLAWLCLTFTAIILVQVLVDTYRRTAGRTQ